MDKPDAVAELRSFNRFFTRTIGVLDEQLLDSGFSLTEARALYEMGAGHAYTARDLVVLLGIDKGYLSRIVGRLEERGLIGRSGSGRDRRERTIQLTPAGREAYDTLQDRANTQVWELLKSLSWTDHSNLMLGTRLVRGALDPGWLASTGVAIRTFQPGDLGWIVERHGALYWSEYGWNAEFEALVAEIVAGFVRTFRDGKEQCWIAEVGGVRAGSVMCVRVDDQTAKLRLLLVEPFARGKGVGKALVEECISFSRQVGYQDMVLWTNDVLTEARGVYEKRGFVLESREPHRSFGHDLVSETWRLDLTTEVVRSPRGPL